MTGKGQVAPVELVEGTFGPSLNNIQFLSLPEVHFTSGTENRSNIGQPIAVSNTRGCIIVSTQDRLLFMRINDLLKIQNEERINKKREINISIVPRVEVNSPHLGTLPLCIQLSTKEEYLALDTFINGVPLVVIYVFKEFIETSGKCQPFCSIRASSVDGDRVEEIEWNPAEATGNLIAIRAGSGTLTVCTIKGREMFEPVASHAMGAKCMCWSPKGKQLVVGKSDGTLVQLKADLQEAKRIGCPVTSPLYIPTSILWIETFQFMVSYGLPNEDISIMQLDVMKKDAGGTQKFCNFHDIFASETFPLVPSTTFSYIPQWSIIICASNTGNEPGIMYKQDKPLSWSPALIEDDARRPILPFDSYNLGSCVYYGCDQEITVSPAEKFPPMPMLFSYTSKGVLYCAHVINIDTQPENQLCKSVPSPLSESIFSVAGPIGQPNTAAGKLIQPISESNKTVFPSTSAAGKLIQPISESNKTVLPSTSAAPVLSDGIAKAPSIQVHQDMQKMKDPVPEAIKPGASKDNSEVVSTDPSKSWKILYQNLEEFEKRYKTFTVFQEAKRQKFQGNFSLIEETYEMMIDKVRKMEILVAEANEANNTQTEEIQSLKERMLLNFSQVEKAKHMLESYYDSKLFEKVGLEVLDPSSSKRRYNIQQNLRYIQTQLSALSFNQRYKRESTNPADLKRKIYQALYNHALLIRTYQQKVDDIKKLISRQNRWVKNCLMTTYKDHSGDDSTSALAASLHKCFEQRSLENSKAHEDDIEDIRNKIAAVQLKQLQLDVQELPANDVSFGLTEAQLNEDSEDPEHKPLVFKQSALKEMVDYCSKFEKISMVVAFPNNIDKKSNSGAAIEKPCPTVEANTVKTNVPLNYTTSSNSTYAGKAAVIPSSTQLKKPDETATIIVPVKTDTVIESKAQPTLRTLLSQPVASSSNIKQDPVLPTGAKIEINAPETGTFLSPSMPQFLTPFSTSVPSTVPRSSNFNLISSSLSTNAQSSTNFNASSTQQITTSPKPIFVTSFSSPSGLPTFSTSVNQQSVFQGQEKKLGDTVSTIVSLTPSVTKDDAVPGAIVTSTKEPETTFPSFPVSSASSIFGFSPNTQVTNASKAEPNVQISKSTTSNPKVSQPLSVTVKSTEGSIPKTTSALPDVSFNLPTTESIFGASFSVVSPLSDGNNSVQSKIKSPSEGTSASSFGNVAPLTAKSNAPVALGTQQPIFVTAVTSTTTGTTISGVLEKSSGFLEGNNILGGNKLKAEAAVTEVTQAAAAKASVVSGSNVTTSNIVQVTSPSVSSISNTPATSPSEKTSENILEKGITTTTPAISKASISSSSLDGKMTTPNFGGGLVSFGSTFATTSGSTSTDSSQKLFGSTLESNSVSTATNAFGSFGLGSQNSVTTKSDQASVFGNKSSPFGGAQTSAFGSAFGSGSNTTFGTNTTTTNASSVFGNTPSSTSSQPQPASFSFTKPLTQAPQTQTATASVFGGNFGSGSLFGATTSTTPSGPFGGTSTSTPSNTAVFGGAPTFGTGTPSFGGVPSFSSNSPFGSSFGTTASSNPTFGNGSSIFGSAGSQGNFQSFGYLASVQQQPGGSVFGGASSGNSPFGSSTSPNFGSQSVFGSQAPTNQSPFGGSFGANSAPSFGTLAQNSGSVFGGSTFGNSSSQPSPFGGQTSQQPAQNSQSSSSFGGNAFSSWR